jgi:hypothetical protein
MPEYRWWLGGVVKLRLHLVLTGKRTVTIGDLEGERLMVMKEGHCLGDLATKSPHGSLTARIQRLAKRYIIPYPKQ